MLGRVNSCRLRPGLPSLLRHKRPRDCCTFVRSGIPRCSIKQAKARTYNLAQFAASAGSPAPAVETSPFRRNCAPHPATRQHKAPFGLRQLDHLQPHPRPQRIQRDVALAALAPLGLVRACTLPTIGYWVKLSCRKAPQGYIVGIQSMRSVSLRCSERNRAWVPISYPSRMC